MTRPRVEITVGEIVLTGLKVRDPAGLADAVGTRLAELVTERGLPQRGEPGPITVHYGRGEPLETVLAEAIYTGIGQETR
ncbi:MAG TPA: hypothetical protein VFE14_14260 [Micromonosporaceae bacterium]|jgi:hypothetical protein|nr:hypothetical protein [Micromonosporaceae bacterium]